MSMDFYLESLWRAAQLLSRLDPEIRDIAMRSVRISASATLLAAGVGVPLGACVALAQFRGKKALVTTLSTLMGLPTVIVGLLLYGLLSRQGSLGALGLLFTPSAIIVAEWLLSLPIITRLTIAAVEAVDPRVHATALTLGASRLQAYLKVLGEARAAVAAAVVTGFGRAISEVGAAMIVGGNIRGVTRTLTTAVALETSKGNFSFALALGLILLSIFFVLNLLFLRLLEAR